MSKMIGITCLILTCLTLPLNGFHLENKIDSISNVSTINGSYVTDTIDLDKQDETIIINISKNETFTLERQIFAIFMFTIFLFSFAIMFACFAYTKQREYGSYVITQAV